LAPESEDNFSVRALVLVVVAGVGSLVRVGVCCVALRGRRLACVSTDGRAECRGHAIPRPMPTRGSSACLAPGWSRCRTRTWGREVYLWCSSTAQSSCARMGLEQKVSVACTCVSVGVYVCVGWGGASACLEMGMCTGCVRVLFIQRAVTTRDTAPSVIIFFAPMLILTACGDHARYCSQCHHLLCANAYSYSVR
jgi:hypothetical protein